MSSSSRNRPFIVGVTGGSGSGKTHFIQKLLGKFEDAQLCLVSQDNYYRPIQQVPVDESGIQNFDLPEAIDFEQFHHDLRELLAGKSITLREYTFNNKRKTPKIITLHPAPLIIVEGIFVMSDNTIFNLLDLKIFIDAEEHIKIKRRIKRDADERGYDLEDVLYRYENHVVPTYHQFIRPYRHLVDVVIPNHGSIENAIDLVSEYLSGKLSS